MTIVTAKRPRAFVRVAGADAADYLQRMLSNDVEALAPGESCEALLLTAKARVIAPLRVLRRAADDFLLLTEPELGDRVRVELVRMRFAAKAEVELEQHASKLVFGEQPPGALPDRYGDDGFDLADYVTRAKQGVTSFPDIPTLAEGLKGLEATRRLDFEDWLDEHKLDAVVLPAVADVGPADADINEASADLAWRNGTWVANGNLVWRHLGIPTVTVPMGTMADIGMPVGLTFAGKAYDDVRLLQFAGDYERATQRRTSPPRTPALADDVFVGRGGLRVSDAAPPAFRLAAETIRQGDQAE